MGIEINATNVICTRCGKAYGRRKGNFLVNYGPLYKGVGYISICKECINIIYDNYFLKCKNTKNSVKQVCRKLDLYWDEKAFDTVEKKSTNKTIMTSYISKINTVSFLGKSYDDTLSREGVLWNYNTYTKKDSSQQNILSINTDTNTVKNLDISEKTISFWGSGYTNDMYIALDQRYKYWTSNLPEDINLDIGTEAIIRQICSLELDINRDRAAGHPVDKSINALNTLLGSASLKPVQKKSIESDTTAEKTPLGVWIRRFENEKPIPEPDPEFEDTDGVIKYISVWFLGHLCKMLGIKNTYCKLYEEELEKLKVERPEYEEEDDNELFNDIFSDKK